MPTNHVVICSIFKCFEGNRHFTKLKNSLPLWENAIHTRSIRKRSNKEKLMKMLFQIGVVFFGLLMAANAYTQDYVNGGAGYQGGQNCCPTEAPCDQPANDCWCKYVHWEPCYYTTQRCIQEAIPCQKQCCRMVPKYFQVQRCRYVPQYYCDTVCRYEPEYYCVPDCKYVNKVVCDQHCRYVPKTYWKHTCGDTTCTNPCPGQ